MGIRGLTSIALKLLKGKNMKNIFPIQQFKQQIWAIDASLFLYRSRTLCVTSNEHKGSNKFRNITSNVPLSQSHIVGFIDLICHLVHYGIIPFVVFDGEPPPEKNETLQKRRQEKIDFQKKIDLVEHSILVSTNNTTNTRTYADMLSSGTSGTSGTLSNTSNTNTISKEEYEHIKKNIEYHKQQANANFVEPKIVYETQLLCQILGIPYHTAQGEAEVTCAILQRTGVVDAIYTLDSDVIALGCTRMIRKIYQYENVEIIDASFVKNELGLTHEQFIAFCVFLGCDFCDGIITKKPDIKPNEIIQFVSSVPCFQPEFYQHIMGHEWVEKAHAAYRIIYQQSVYTDTHHIKREHIKIVQKNINYSYYFKNILHFEGEKLIQQIKQSFTSNDPLRFCYYTLPPLYGHQDLTTSHDQDCDTSKDNQCDNHLHSSPHHWYVQKICNDSQDHNYSLPHTQHSKHHELIYENYYLPS